MTTWGIYDMQAKHRPDGTPYTSKTLIASVPYATEAEAGAAAQRLKRLPEGSWRRLAVRPVGPLDRERVLLMLEGTQPG